MTAWLTLATGLDRYEKDPDGWVLKEEGRLWRLARWPMGGRFPALKREVAEWCYDHIRAYRIIEHAPSDKRGPAFGDSWRIEFKNDGDMLLFKAEWGEK